MIHVDTRGFARNHGNHPRGLAVRLEKSNPIQKSAPDQLSWAWSPFAKIPDEPSVRQRVKAADRSPNSASLLVQMSECSEVRRNLALLGLGLKSCRLSSKLSPPEPSGVIDVGRSRCDQANGPYWHEHVGGVRGEGPSHRWLALAV